MYWFYSSQIHEARLAQTSRQAFEAVNRDSDGEIRRFVPEVDFEHSPVLWRAK
jgi:hypothetical protein